MITNEATRLFISQHANDNIRTLALAAHGKPDIDLPFALDQIAGRQSARKKLPSWHVIEGIIFPPHLSMEQCSSEATALYKQSLLERLVCQDGGISSFADLTGGFGVDFSFLASRFGKAIYVERQQRLCDIATHNFKLLGLTQAEVVCDEAESWLKIMPRVDLVYLDPARRDAHGARTFAIADCTPNVVTLKTLLLEKAGKVMIKLSPMLDWRKAVSDLGEENVSEVHAVSVNNECKELLLVMTPEKAEAIEIVCVDIRSNDGEVKEVKEVKGDGEVKEVKEFKEVKDNTESRRNIFDYSVFSTLQNPSFLYEPNASLMKIGCFDMIEERFGVCQVSANSHLFVSDHEVKDFPGRSFHIVGITTMNKREMKDALADIKSANITVRNFPLTTAELRKKLKLKDGGDVYIFATTFEDNQHRLIICKKALKKT